MKLPDVNLLVYAYNRDAHPRLAHPRPASGSGLAFPPVARLLVASAAKAWMVSKGSRFMGVNEEAGARPDRHTAAIALW